MCCSRGGAAKEEEGADLDITTFDIMQNREGQRRRRSAAALIVAASLGSHSVETSAAVGQSPEPQHSNIINLRRRRPAQLQIISQHRRIESINSECKGSSLNPGDILQQNEFVCHGQLRFGIDYRGRFILGFDSDTDTTNPEMIAWQAKPTTLFVDPDRPFEFVRLTDGGNILGFDSSYTEIYDSNYDNQNRQQGKEDGSILLPSDDCLLAESVQPSIFCMTLTSQPKPGMPNGMTTWGVKVDTDTMIAFEPLSSSPTPAPTLQPSQHMTTSSPSDESTAGTWSPAWNSTDSSFNSTFAPTVRLTTSPSHSPSIAPSKGSIQIGSQAARKTIIYGYVWQDGNQDGKMGREETRFPDFEVKFYECMENGQISSAGSVRTDVEGLYFIQLPYGDYRALYEVNQDVYGYSVGVQDSTSGWTDCMSSSNTIVVSSVGLYSKDAVPATLADVPSTEASIINVPGLPPTAEAITVATIEEKEVKLSSIAGFIYIDTNNNKTMDSDERSIAVKGYTIGDAIVKVSLIDCQPDNSVLPSVKFVPFPGHYMFSNLTEGSYKLKFELISVDPNATITSMYQFIDGTNQVSASRESQCGKLGQGQDNDQGDVGVQAVELLPLQGEIVPESAPADFEIGSSEALNTGGPSENGGGGSNVSGIIGGVVVACALVAGAAIFVLRKRQPSSIVFSLGHGHKDRIENRGSLGPSIDGDMSTTSDGGSTLVDRSASGMHAAEQELDDHDSESSRSSDDDDTQQDSIDYGPVVSNIIAQYSQQHHHHHHQIEIYSQDDQQHQHHYQNQPQPATYRNADHETSQTESGYYNNSHTQYYHQQQHQSQYNHHDQYDSASTYSNNSADPPAASYASLSHQNELVDREGYEVQYEKHSPVHSDSDSESSAEESNDNVVSRSAPSQCSPDSRSRSNPRDNRDTSSWKKQAIPEDSTVEYNSQLMRERTSAPHIDDNKSVISSGSDQSSDPPGASYKDTPLDRFPAPPPRHQGLSRGRSVPPPPPRQISPQQQRYVSPQQQRRISPQQQRYVSPHQQRHLSPQHQRLSPSQYQPPQD